MSTAPELAKQTNPGQPTAMADSMATAATPAEKKDDHAQSKERKPQQRRVDDTCKVFSGTANQALADEACHYLGLERGQAWMTRFSDGENYVQLLENVRGEDVVV